MLLFFPACDRCSSVGDISVCPSIWSPLKLSLISIFRLFSDIYFVIHTLLCNGKVCKQFVLVLSGFVFEVIHSFPKQSDTKQAAVVVLK